MDGGTTNVCATPKNVKFAIRSDSDVAVGLGVATCESDAVPDALTDASGVSVGEYDALVLGGVVYNDGDA